MNLMRRISSRKFIVLIIAVGLFLIKPDSFTGDNMVIVMGIFVGGNVLEKFTKGYTGE